MTENETPVVRSKEERIRTVLEEHGVVAPDLDELINDLAQDALVDTVCEWQRVNDDELLGCEVVDVHGVDPNTDFDGTFYVPGEGFGVQVNSTVRGGSLDEMYDMIHQRLKGRKPNEGRFGGGNRGVFLTERHLMSLLATLRNHQRKHGIGAADRARETALDHASKVYDGTDCRSPHKHPLHEMHRGREDDFGLDTSRSSITLCICQGTDRMLNGSAAKHNRTVRISVSGPTGRELVEVEMTFEQLAAFLTSNGPVPCTCASYWSHNEYNVRLRERVREPESIKDRLAKRLESKRQSLRESFRDILEEIDETAKTGKMGKTKAKELFDRLERAVSTVTGHADFVSEQAVEETSAMLETAAIHLMNTYGVPAEEIKRMSGIGSLIGDSVPTPRIEHDEGDQDG